MGALLPKMGVGLAACTIRRDIMVDVGAGGRCGLKPMPSVPILVA
jgi:hypothetical protein